MSALDIWGQDELEKQTCLAEEQKLIEEGQKNPPKNRKTKKK